MTISTRSDNIAAPKIKPLIIPRNQHPLSRSLISDNALYASLLRDIPAARLFEETLIKSEFSRGTRRCRPKSNNLAITQIIDFEARHSASSAEP